MDTVEDDLEAWSYSQDLTAHYEMLFGRLDDDDPSVYAMGAFDGDDYDFEEELRGPEIELFVPMDGPVYGNITIAPVNEQVAAPHEPVELPRFDEKVLDKINQSTLPSSYAESEWKNVYEVLDPSKKGKRARLARQQVVSYSRKDDLLYYHHDGRDNPVLVVPVEEIQHAIIEYVHDTLMGHAGAAATVDRIRQQFWWTGMAKMVRKHVQHCKQCNRHQPRTARPYMNMQRLPTPKEMGTHYAMDLCTDLPPAGPISNPYDMVLVICDKFSGRIFAYPTRKTAKAADIAEIIDAKLIHEMGRGVMMDIRCDNDPRFGQKVFGNLMARKGIKISKTSPGHSLSNAAAERSILALEIMLRGMCVTARHWLSRLPFALFALNTRPMNRLGGLCPLEVENGRTPLTPLDLRIPAGLRMRKVPKTMRALFERFSQIRSEVNECKQAAFDIMSTQYDKHRTFITKEELPPGSRVFVSSKHLAAPYQKGELGKCKKLRAVFYGPYKVIRWRGPATLQLDLPQNIWPRKAGDALFPVSRVKPYLEADGTVRALQKQGLVRIPDKGDFVVGREYKVRHILGHKGIPGTTKGKNKAMYLVNWDGFDAEDQQYVAETEVKSTAKRLLRKYLQKCTARGLLKGNEPIDEVLDSDTDDGTESGNQSGTEDESDEED